MARCEDCVHFDVCYLSEIDNDIRDNGENPNCLHYAPNSEWISVDERLPEENTRVLGYSRLLDEICCYDITKDTTEIHWWTEDSGWYRASELNITHWMPLPETPKGD